MYREIVEIASKIANGVRLDEKLTPEQLMKAREELASTDIRPCSSDVTFESWLDRINLWGDVKCVHDDPEFRFNGVITQAKFLDKMNDDEYMCKAFGKWEMDVPHATTLIYWRDYVGLDGKKHREKFIFTVNVNPRYKQLAKEQH